jgi:hypothetical protein
MKSLVPDCNSESFGRFFKISSKPIYAQQLFSHRDSVCNQACAFFPGNL